MTQVKEIVFQPQTIIFKTLSEDKELDNVQEYPNEHCGYNDLMNNKNIQTIGKCNVTNEFSLTIYKDIIELNYSPLIEIPKSELCGLPYIQDGDKYYIEGHNEDIIVTNNDSATLFIENILFDNNMLNKLGKLQEKLLIIDLPKKENYIIIYKAFFTMFDNAIKIDCGIKEYRKVGDQLLALFTNKEE